MTMAAFDIRADLPEGTTVLEASAGTGKTYAIVGLATRFLAEGKAKIADLLLVTFSRAATQELRERARDRIVEAEAALADPAVAREDADDLIRHLADVSDAEVATRRRRLREALSDFDAGMIVTTHGFCQRMLDGLGFAGDYDPDLTLVERVDDLLAEVVTDLYLARYGEEALKRKPPIDFETAAKVAKDAVYDRQARLVPETGGDEAAQHRFAFARDARAEVALRKQRMRLRDYDDLLGLLHDVLVDGKHGDAACARIRTRFRVVLVDEFQDTDPLQWEILSRTFHGHAVMVLVGDPKQAIYAFRGAEVLSYLDAVRHASQHQELTTNWRSDAALLTALDRLYGGKALGHEEIVVGSVDAAQNEPRLLGAAPLRVRYLPRVGPWALSSSGLPAVADGTPPDRRGRRPRHRRSADRTGALPVRRCRQPTAAGGTRRRHGARTHPRSGRDGALGTRKGRRAVRPRERDERLPRAQRHALAVAALRPRTAAPARPRPHRRADPAARLDRRPTRGRR